MDVKYVIYAVFIGLVFVFFAAVLGVCVYIAVASRKRIHAIAGTEAGPVGELDEGYRKVTGRVVALEDPIRSPLTRTECVFYSFRVTEFKRNELAAAGLRRRGRHDAAQERLVVVVDDKDAVRCAVEDKTGRAGLALLDAETVLKSARTRSGMFRDCPRDLRDRLARKYGFDTKGLLVNKDLQYEETVLEDGDKVFVIGDVEFGKSGKPRFVKGEQPFIVSDRDETKVVEHYRVRAKWATVGGAVVAGLMVLAAVVLLVVVVVNLLGK